MPKQILLVEDSTTMQKVIEITFANEDYRIASARDGEDALTRLREVRPDVLIVDAGLPSQSGYDVVAALKADGQMREVPTLLLTGNFNPYDEARGQRVGVDSHVVKPFETQVLIDKVSDLLRRRAGATGTSNAQTLIAMPPLPGADKPVATAQSVPIGALSPANAGETKRTTIPPRAPAAPAARPAADTGLQRSTLMGIPAVNPIGAPGLRPPPPPGMRVRETGNLPAINPPPASSASGIIGAGPASSSSAGLPSWGARSIELGRSPGNAAPPSTTTSPLAPAAAAAPAALVPAASSAPVPAPGIPMMVPQMPRLPLLPRAPLPAAVTAVLERIAQRGSEYEAIAKLSIEVIEQICWEVIPELAEVILRAEVERHVASGQLGAKAQDKT